MTSDSSINELTERIESLKQTDGEKTVQLHELEEMRRQYEQNIEKAESVIQSAQNSVSGLELKQESKNQKKNEVKAECDKLTLDVREHQRKITFLENM